MPPGLADDPCMALDRGASGFRSRELPYDIYAAGAAPAGSCHGGAVANVSIDRLFVL
jgi:hypothetical protein